MRYKLHFITFVHKHKTKQHVRVFSHQHSCSLVINNKYRFDRTICSCFSCLLLLLFLSAHLISACFMFKRGNFAATWCIAPMYQPQCFVEFFFQHPFSRAFIIYGNLSSLCGHRFGQWFSSLNAKCHDILFSSAAQVFIAQLHFVWFVHAPVIICLTYSLYLVCSKICLVAQQWHPVNGIYYAIALKFIESERERARAS